MHMKTTPPKSPNLPNARLAEIGLLLAQAILRAKSKDNNDASCQRTSHENKHTSSNK